MSALAEQFTEGADATVASVLEANPHRASLATMTISRATDLWLGAVELSERTVDTYRRLLDKLAEGRDDIDVADLSAVDVRRFLDSQSRKRDGSRKAAGSIAQNVSIVSGFFDWLKKEGIIDRNPTRRNEARIIDRPAMGAPEDNDSVVTVSSEEVRRLKSVADQMGGSEMLAINCLIYLGPRRRALSQARIRDFDQVERLLTFREKGGRTISKPVPDELAAVLDTAINNKAYKSPRSYLIPSKGDQRRKGERDDRIIWRLVRNVAAKARVTTHVHALRAAFAVHYLEANPGDVVGLQKLMGHRRIETTIVYLRRFTRRQAMETVRTLSWIPANTEELLDALHVTEKEGFEPSLPSKPLRQRDGSQGGSNAP